MHEVPAIGQTGRSGIVAVGATAFLLAIAEFRLISFYFLDYIVQNVAAAQGVLDGLPHWRVYQSRVLGPLVMAAVSWLGPSLLNAYFITGIGALTAAAVVTFRVGRRLEGPAGGWAAMMGLLALFPLVLSRPWLYIWDFFILVIGATFLLLVVRRAPWWAFLALMAVAFLNHESALFIAIWMAVQGLADNWMRWRLAWRQWDWRLLGGGVVGGVVGLEVVELLRTLLLNREIGPELFADASQIGDHTGGMHIKLLRNLGSVIDWFITFDYSFPFLIPLLLLCAVAVVGVLLARYRLKAAGLAVYVAAQVAALCIAAELAETRVLLQLVPFLAVAPLLLNRTRWLDEEAIKAPAP
ncbi:hypothetical protein [Nitrospirillum viridazoti]|uniref:Glycosyltransferase RgtA/B/C/D-like domain-containing protein n=1 Tax=Nitrospirillum viridazoti CBAmc TaxID=1441467 RepID=A0A248JVZ0_9PROT|nr:hypothetical protein [Nitrospirillum amazonense]ASG22892.1 hypothetical protein Y958_18535 [Nitrospirillum amazonense CBAmc]TWB31499.1 hypothetical protein FBZ91_11995 [Nitrospirillum amazonense]